MLQATKEGVMVSILLRKKFVIRVCIACEYISDVAGCERMVWQQQAASRGEAEIFHTRERAAGGNHAGLV